MPPPACRRLCDRSDPRAQPGSPLNLAFSPILRACAPRFGEASSTAFLADTMLTSLRRVRTRSAFAAQEPASPWRPVKAAWVTGHYPDPSRARTPSVVRSGTCWLERPAPPGARAPAPSSPGEPMTPPAEPSTPPVPARTASRLPPRRGRRSAAPKVSSVPENSPGKVPVPTRRAGQGPSPLGDWASFHRLFSICGKGARAFFILRHALLGRSTGMCRSRMLKDIGSRPIRLVSLRSAPGLLRSGRSAAWCAAELPNAKVSFLSPFCNRKIESSEVGLERSSYPQVMPRPAAIFPPVAHVFPSICAPNRTLLTTAWH